MTASHTALADEHLLRGWTAYGLREIYIARMLPDVMQVESTSVCNLRCVFCPYDKLTRKKEALNVALFRDFIQQQCSHVSSMGLHHFGEPFLNRLLPHYVEICTQSSIATTVSTNATRMPVELVRRTFNAGLSRLIFSLDGTAEDEYEKLRSGATYKTVVANIFEVLALKQREGGPYVQMQLIITPENRRNVWKFVSQWKDHGGVDQVVLRDERTHGGQRIRHNRYVTRYGKRWPCRYLWESVVVLVDGTVVPCCKDYDGKVVFGNVFRGDSLEAIWNSGPLLAMRRAHVEDRFSDIPLCASCSEWPGHKPLNEDESRDLYRHFRERKQALRRSQIYRKDFE